MYSREIITVQVGGTGQEFGGKFWNSVSGEHGITPSDGKQSEYADGNSGEILDNPHVMFSQGRDGTFSPRLVLCDLVPDSINKFLSHSKLKLSAAKSTYPTTYPGSGNCYASAFHTEGAEVANIAIDSFRRELEQCNCLQAVQFLHSTSGGAGSGLSGLLMRSFHDFLDKGSKRMFYSGSLFPSPLFSDIVLESYNTTMVLQDMAEYCQMVFPFDTMALSSKPQSFLPNCLSAVSSSSRFPGLLNADLVKLHTYLVPFKNAQFLITSNTVSEKSSLTQMTENTLSRGTPGLSIDSHSPGSRYLSTFLAVRGRGLKASHIDTISAELQREGSYFDKFFPDWIPNSVCASVAGPDRLCGDTVSLTSVNNSTAVHQFFDRLLKQFDKRFKSKSHIYVYEENGVHPEEMLEARNLVQYISDQYKEYARWEDKILLPGNGINAPAITNDEQRRLSSDLVFVASL